jgi:hypothetical protein
MEFQLQAARVSRPNSPGDLSGLAAVKPGSHVWLMMYYNITALPKSARRITTYEVLRGKQTIFKVVYKGSSKAGEVGRFSRYAVYNVPSSLRFGQYAYRATLTIAGRRQTKTWKFTVGKREVPAKAST